MLQQPAYLAGAVDAIRNIGNFAAHPIKSQSTGEVVDVEPGEAEWLLDVLDSLFRFYFVEPAELATRGDELNAKLSDVGLRRLRSLTPLPLPALFRLRQELPGSTRDEFVGRHGYEDQ